MPQIDDDERCDCGLYTWGELRQIDQYRQRIAALWRERDAARELYRKLLAEFYAYREHFSTLDFDEWWNQGTKKDYHAAALSIVMDAWSCGERKGMALQSQRADAAEARVRELEKYKSAVERHLDPNELAMWLACSLDHVALGGSGEDCALATLRAKVTRLEAILRPFTLMRTDAPGFVTAFTLAVVAAQHALADKETA